MYTEGASEGAIWEEFREKHKNQSIKKTPYLMPNFIFLWCK